jgi:hypothetical protein
VLGQTFDVRELVDQAGGGQNAPSNDGVPAGEFNSEEVVIRAGHAGRAIGEDLSAVAADLLTASADKRRRRIPFTTEVAVHVCGGGVARLAGVDNDDRPALAPELERGC